MNCKEYADSTLMRMTKKKLIEYVREMERDVQSITIQNERQSELIMTMMKNGNIKKQIQKSVGGKWR